MANDAVSKITLGKALSEKIAANEANCSDQQKALLRSNRENTLLQLVTEDSIHAVPHIPYLSREGPYELFLDYDGTYVCLDVKVGEDVLQSVKIPYLEIQQELRRSWRALGRMQQLQFQSGHTDAIPMDKIRREDHDLGAAKLLKALNNHHFPVGLAFARDIFDLLLQTLPVQENTALQMIKKPGGLRFDR